MKSSLVGLILVVAVLVSGAAGYLAGTGSQTMTTTQFSTTTYFVTKTLPIVSNTTFSSSTCTNTGGLGCPHFFNETFTVTVEYDGPWGLSYQGYLGAGTSGTPVQSGNFYGHGATNETITVSGTDTYGITACVQAQKLDASNAVLILKLPPSNSMNQTALPYGTVRLCVAQAIV